MTTTIDTRVEAARQALRTHDQLRQVEAVGDAFETGPDDLPIDSVGWLAWHHQRYRPALEAWQQAMQLLALAVGAEFPGRHPHNWRPVCELILSRAQAAAATTSGDGSEPGDRRAVLLRRMGGEGKAVRAEQLRARGVPDRMIARQIGIGLRTVRVWFHLQDQLLLTEDTEDDDAAVELTYDPARVGSEGR
jgi:hypothetical protein